ncbi:MAG: bifunctional DNA primase/polymerase, partial [Clostridia bacterium]
MAMNMPDSPALTEALRLASHGFKIIRLHWPTKQGCSCGRPNCKKSIGKHPIANNWVAAGTDDPNTIRKLWRETPYANVGVPMGQINGIFALDVDGPEGIQTLQEWIAEYGELPATWQVQTGGGGIQLWYKIPEGMQIPNSVKKIGVNIDIRGDGGQSVAPGSLHKSGKRYRWAPGRSPEDIPLAEPPEWLINKIKEVIQAREKA